MQSLSTLNTSEPIDYDNLSIVTHPRPPRRRQSGISLVPYRPYVKCLTGIEEPFSFTNGKDQWMAAGERKTLFKQQNARCIGSLLDDCDVSDVIRWDIEGESTRLPMMCKLWMIVDGAVVERGKPHLVQDAAVQVFTDGRSYRSILESEQRYKNNSIPIFDRRRRHSWHDVNEYHSVPYHQYTRALRLGSQESVQCNMDDEHSVSVQQFLPFIREETVDEHQATHLEFDMAEETVYDLSTPQDRVQISSMTQTEHQLADGWTETDDLFIQLFNLNIQPNETLLSSVANPYVRDHGAVSSWQTATVIIDRNNTEYVTRSVSTGDDYPQWWLQLSTNLLLSDHITKQGEEKTILVTPPPRASSTPPLPSSTPPPSPRQLDQSIQTDTEHDTGFGSERPGPSSSTRSSRLHKSSSSVTINNHYEVIDEIDDGNNARRVLPFHDRRRVDSHGDLESHSSDYPIETFSARDSDQTNRRGRTTSSSKQSETDYNTFSAALNQQSYSTPEPYATRHHHHHQPSAPSRSTSSMTKEIYPVGSPSSALLSTLLQRYERTLRERQRAITIVNEQFLDVDDVLKRYREKMEGSKATQSDRAMELRREISILAAESKEERPLLSTRFIADKYRSMPSISSEEMLQGYIPIPRLIPDYSSRQRQPRFDYCDLCVTNYGTSSAWIRYNEDRIDQLQKRIDIMLQIDDNDEAQLYFTPFNPVTQYIDEVLSNKPKYRNQISYYHNRILSPRRYNFRFPYRLNETCLTSPRLLTRNLTRSTIPISKSVRIATDPDLIPHQTRLRTPRLTSTTVSRPLVSILRRNSTTFPSHSRRLVEASHVWKNDNDGKVYILEQFSIPRYYRLYNDVSFREVYNFSRVLETYLNRTSSEHYSSIIKNFALNQQLPTIASVA